MHGKSFWYASAAQQRPNDFIPGSSKWTANTLKELHSLVQQSEKVLAHSVNMELAWLNEQIFEAIQEESHNKSPTPLVLLTSPKKFQREDSPIRDYRKNILAISPVKIPLLVDKKPPHPDSDLKSSLYTERDLKEALFREDPGSSPLVAVLVPQEPDLNHKSSLYKDTDVDTHSDEDLSFNAISRAIRKSIARKSIVAHPSVHELSERGDTNTSEVSNKGRSEVVTSRDVESSGNATLTLAEPTKSVESVNAQRRENKKSTFGFVSLPSRNPLSVKKAADAKPDLDSKPKTVNDKIMTDSGKNGELKPPRTDTDLFATMEISPVASADPATHRDLSPLAVYKQAPGLAKVDLKKMQSLSPVNRPDVSIQTEQTDEEWIPLPDPSPVKPRLQLPVASSETPVVGTVLEIPKLERITSLQNPPLLSHDSSNSVSAIESDIDRKSSPMATLLASVGSTLRRAKDLLSPRKLQRPSSPLRNSPSKSGRVTKPTVSVKPERGSFMLPTTASQLRSASRGVQNDYNGSPLSRRNGNIGNGTGSNRLVATNLKTVKAPVFKPMTSTTTLAAPRTAHEDDSQGASPLKRVRGSANASGKVNERQKSSATRADPISHHENMFLATSPAAKVSESLTKTPLLAQPKSLKRVSLLNDLRPPVKPQTVVKVPMAAKREYDRKQLASSKPKETLPRSASVPQPDVHELVKPARKQPRIIPLNRKSPAFLEANKNVAKIKAKMQVSEVAATIVETADNVSPAEAANGSKKRKTTEAVSLSMETRAVRTSNARTESQRTTPVVSKTSDFFKPSMGLQKGNGSGVHSKLVGEMSKTELAKTRTLLTRVSIQANGVIPLPEIFSESEDDEEGSVLKEWAKTPELNKVLLSQLQVDPDKVFGPIAPLRMEEIFNSNLSRMRARNSSSWTGQDKLTPDEIDEYTKNMGYKNGKPS
ncbi:hypothetical protein BABINDRAFT_78769 [Babjeviella inositovora NRRL Y-12698]|uniref:Inner centromere protein ARK-binding domain-containing protein n=1 Tax=Babjeviella inositovora NRRL Y-12698 TaxID=984486 RepID=A0A1E3R0R7_9ASCO|nr:uncharacterized protein BABINDRAFT_78769 [Babjeviella inositovora NRRL Y-12698]ODQ82942.1 hypothetical protein BABINDRAFT_78769 [Babjeviella inositovora NRRL Y-12698]